MTTDRPCPTILDRLMAPLSAADFCTRYWQKRAVHVACAATERLAGAPSLDEVLARAVAAPEAFQLSAGYRDAKGRHRQIAVQARQTRELMNAGLTLQINRLATEYPALADALAGLRRRLRLPRPGDAAMFASQRGSGYAVHFDAMDLWVVQTDGRKRWAYSLEPAATSPSRNCIWDPDRPPPGVRTPEETAMTEVVLSPGDVLYLPAGTWHTAEALEPCTHIALSFKPYDVVELLLEEVLERVCEQRAAWRSIPSFPEQDAAGALASTEAYLEVRLAELRALLAPDALSAKSLVRTWLRRVA